MKKYFLLLIVFVFSVQQFSFARDWFQRKESYFQLKEVLKKNSKMSLTNVKDSLAYEMKKLADLQLQLSNSQTNVNKMALMLQLPLHLNPSATRDAEILETQKSISSLRMYVIIFLIIIAFLSFRLFMEGNKRMQNVAQALDSKISLTKHDLERYLYELEKEALRIDNRLIQVLHEQLSIIKEERAARISDNPLMEFIPVTDHRLPIKVGEEIHRMRKRIENMDKEVKGLGALVNSINRLSEELASSGYEMEDLMGKKYVDGMKIEARFVDNPDIPPGEERITDVLRPEIKYKGEVIQVAKVEVGKSY